MQRSVLKAVGWTEKVEIERVGVKVKLSVQVTCKCLVFQRRHGARLGCHMWLALTMTNGSSYCPILSIRTMNSTLRVSNTVVDLNYLNLEL